MLLNPKISWLILDVRPDWISCKWRNKLRRALPWPLSNSPCVRTPSNVLFPASTFPNTASRKSMNWKWRETREIKKKRRGQLKDDKQNIIQVVACNWEQMQTERKTKIITWKTSSISFYKFVQMVNLDKHQKKIYSIKLQFQEGHWCGLGNNCMLRSYDSYSWWWLLLRPCYYGDDD